MKKKLFIPQLFILSAIIFSIIFIISVIHTNNNSTIHPVFNPENSKRIAGYEVARKYFEVWNHPYPKGIPAEVQTEIWNQINTLPAENDINENVISPWVNLNLTGIHYPDSVNIRYTGRVKDIEPNNSTTSIRIGAASGGIWEYDNYAPVCISDKLSCTWIGSFATDPDDNNVIFVGTGEPRVNGGNGLWKTTNRGNSWIKDYFAGYTPWCFYKIRFDPNNSNKIHAASSDGYFRSDNNGNNWENKYDGIITDFCVNVTNSNIIYIAQKSVNGLGGGILKSTDGGDNFIRIYSLPYNNIARSVIDCGNSSSVVYALLGNGSNDSLLGLYKSTNSGSNWTNITPQNTQAFGLPALEYMAVVSVCPGDANIVMAGTKSLCRSTNGGMTWTEYLDYGNNPIRNLHGDHHRLVWKDDNVVLSANDGGIAMSIDKGAKWNTLLNLFPITQFYHFDVGTSNKKIIYGGTQDNGTIKTENLGHNWLFIFGGDGGTNVIDPANSNKVFVSHQASGDITYPRYKTTNAGNNWDGINNNLPPHNEWSTIITSDKTPPIDLYTHAGPHVYKSTNEGANWVKLNTTAFPSTAIFSLSVSKYVTGGAVVYAGLRDEPESGNHAGKLLRILDNGTWYERSAGLPQTGAWVRTISIHPTNTNTSYVLMNGVLGQKIFKTTNRGINWTNITGVLPNTPVSDLIPHPTDNNKLYLGTEYGCYKTTNGGTNWMKWNYGLPHHLPQSCIINDLAVIDSLSQNGKYYILAGTYGRGIWMREISSDDPIGIINNAYPLSFNLSQNYPNPFNPNTVIKFSIPAVSNVKIVVFDLLGKIVATIINEKKNAGIHSIMFNGSNLASGVYFYRIETIPVSIYEKRFIDTKKMILLK